VAIFGSHSSFCSSDPYRQIGNLDRDRATQPGVGRFQLPAGHAVGDRAHPGAAVTGQVHAEQAQLAQLRHQVPGHGAGLEPVGDVRLDPVGGELADRVADQPLVRGQLVIDAQQVGFWGGGWHWRVLSACWHPGY
jgi:hypothetical protein